MGGELGLAAASRQRGHDEETAVECWHFTARLDRLRVTCITSVGNVVKHNL
jgi:hypothetical protein